MASMFKKPKRNFRKKNNEFDDVIEIEDSNGSTNGDTDLVTCLQPKKEKKKNKTKDSEPVSKTKSVLSFELEEDDETEVFKIKRSSHSKRVAKQLKKELKEKEKPDKDEVKPVQKVELEVVKDETKYTTYDDGVAERLRERKEREEEEARLAADKIKRLREEFKTLNGEEARGSSSEDDEEKGFKAKLARGEIPDAKTIHYIRKQRQMARDGDGYIAIEENNTSSKSSTQRLVRDDDNDKSDDDEDDRVDFRIDQAARERQEIRDKFLAHEHGSDESDQEREWENQQIQKAVNLNVPILDTHDSNDSSSQVAFLTSSSSSAHGNGITESEKQKPFTALSKGLSISDFTIESVRKQMQERLETADSIHRGHKQEYDRIEFDLSEATESISACEKKAPDLENRYQFFQELRGYVRDLLECLNEKVPIINDMETRINTLLKSRAERLIRRRQQDIKDQCRDYMTNTANVKLDSEGREDSFRQRRGAEREARRARRRRMRESKNVTSHYDGLSSDDEDSSQSLVNKFNNEIESVRQAQSCLFDDVVEDFSNPECVKEQFERWKFTYGDTYRDAYIGLCMPKLLNPFVRNDLILWNPLNEDSHDFESSSWFSILVYMGFKDEDNMEREDDDLLILPSIVEKIILPKLLFLAQDVWDPLSVTQTERLVELTERLTTDYPSVHADSKYFRAYMEAVVGRLQKTLDDDVFMPMYPLSVLDNKSSGATIFFHRQSWSCIKLLENMLSWHELISPTVLQKLALSGLLNRYIVIGLASSHINREALYKCQKVISALPKTWFADLDGESTLPQLENLCRYLVAAARTLHKATALEREVERVEGRELVKQITKHLVNIHAMDHAMVLANEFSFKI